MNNTLQGEDFVKTCLNSCTPRYARMTVTYPSAKLLLPM